MRAASALSPGPRMVNCGSPSGGRGARPRRHQEEPTAPQLHAKAPGAAGGGECRKRSCGPWAVSDCRRQRPPGVEERSPRRPGGSRAEPGWI